MITGEPVASKRANRVANGLVVQRLELRDRSGRVGQSPESTRVVGECSRSVRLECSWTQPDPTRRLQIVDHTAARARYSGDAFRRLEARANMTRRLGIGFIGSGFMTRSTSAPGWACATGDVRGVWSPNHSAGRGGGAGAGAGASATPWPIRSIEAMVERIRRSTASGSAARTTHGSTTWSASWRRSGRGAQPGGGGLREAARTQCPRSRVGWWSSSSGAGLLHGYLENQLFHPAVARGKAGGVDTRRRAVPDGPTWRAPLKNTPGRMPRGSGAATCRAAAC